MKKIMLIAGIILLVISLTGCTQTEQSSEASGSNSFVGTWVFESEGIEWPTAYYVFNPDGTLNYGGVFEGTWVDHGGTMTINIQGLPQFSGTLPYVFSNNRRTVTFTNLETGEESRFNKK
jgi:hypothetical protein